MTLSFFDRHPGHFAGLGLLLSLPALSLVVAGLLQAATGRELLRPPEALLHPALVLGGLLAALVLNALPHSPTPPLLHSHLPIRNRLAFTGSVW
ncbi:MAG TPA: hypothetical protein VD997_02155 [Phycisphaerales bacterium]|nr:hypothetical protein [Phycisphaerales bacterium]